MSEQTRQKISAAKKKAWAELSPEIRKERAAKGNAARLRNEQIRRIKSGRQHNVGVVPSFWVDDDFDEGL